LHKKVINMGGCPICNGSTLIRFSVPYDEGDYIRSYGEFKNAATALKESIC